LWAPAAGGFRRAAPEPPSTATKKWVKSGHKPLGARLISVYTINVTFEWHDEKARRNALKHGIDFRTAAFTFDDPCAFILEDAKHSRDEAR